MRKIEHEMLSAIKGRKDWVKANTGVFMECADTSEPRAEIYLHGHHIADYWYKSGELDVDEHTLSLDKDRRKQLAALGNAVVPVQVLLALEHLLEADK